MGTPVGNPSGYDNSSVMKYVSDMTGRLTDNFDTSHTDASIPHSFI
jgi:hypothetical protein